MPEPVKEYIEQDFAKLNCSPQVLKAIYSAVKEAYNSGYCDAEEEFQFDEEKVGVEYAKEAFAELTNLEAFQDKYKEITNRSFNFQQPLGL
jgi:hypothetical protein